ncbi:alpha-D-ribose 1-methylphosphonate 5-triphosphate diphosphatase [Enemella evansiae]|uniref:alpha-D-ribose 1-methylphosphonate 5-triphosphate diphosphatase n=1 Tax=Enemella evansiae TaxID=2016499 RepID=UPI000B96BAD2|nr:alpha-D-ribose 1-methylphosphonate 5-triphosphate diphosphatase [Enemella evansiae]OYO01769.1 alpha-D-ribose 1-methylphosphonate 5-triphosphate diphosphatase [Enemella evansiae]
MSQLTDTATRTDGWPIGSAPTDYVLSGVRAVLPDRVLPSASVVVREGRIAEITDRMLPGDLDGRGRLLLPGLIDVHSDALEKERAPRPSAVLPWDFVLGSFEDKLAAAGVLTMFHGAGFQHKQARGVIREPGAALALCRSVSGHPGHGVRHRILHRLDVLSEPGSATLRTWLAERTDDGVPPLVSHEDHTPGQGQYVDPEHLVTYIVGADGKTPEEARAQVESLRLEAAEKEPVRRANLAWLGELARSGAIRLMGHDPDSPEAVTELVERGAAVAEFPTTRAAAEAARAAGLLIVAGAPNVLRGGSHNGNVSAGELARAGLLDALASDYLPTALLGSVSVLAPELGLPAAVGFVTSGPARVAGLPDTGTLTVGERADLLLVSDDRGPWLRVAAALPAPPRAPER